MQKIPVVKPTDTEKEIWAALNPAKKSGLIRNKAFVFKDAVEWDEWYRNPDPLEPDDYETKILAGCRGEWFASVVDGRRRILDLGCGFGFPSFYLARYDHDIVGLDVSPSEIETTRSIAQRMGNPTNITFDTYNGCNLPFKDHSFDAATFSTSLECMQEPAALMRELIRVLKPGSPIAIEEEDRSKDPKTDPVWEKCRWTFFNAEIWIWYELRISDPDLDRRYMLKINPDSRLAQELGPIEHLVLNREKGLPREPFEKAGVPLSTALSEVIYAEYSEVRGFTPVTLKSFLLEMDLTDIRFFLQPDGRKFAQFLANHDLLPKMPTDVRRVLQALVRSVPAVHDPISCMVAARTPLPREP